LIVDIKVIVGIKAITGEIPDVFKHKFMHRDFNASTSRLNDPSPPE